MPAEILSSDWLPHRISPGSGEVTFVQLGREARSALPFLTEEYIAAGQPHVTMSSQDAVEMAGVADGGVCHFIFHSAFCCSTLLARALDRPGSAVSLKEPAVILDLSSAPRGIADAMLRPIISLLSRPLVGAECTIIKPTNAANGVIDLILNGLPHANAVFLYNPLPTFLRSVAGKGLWGRIWARRLFAALDKNREFDAGFGPAELWQHSDLQIAALGWLYQQAQFARLLGRCPKGRAIAIESPAFLADPIRTLSYVSRLFGIQMTSNELLQIAEGPIFASDSKKAGRAFDGSLRAGSNVSHDGVLQAEIDMVVQWAGAVAAHVGVPLRLPHRQSS